MSGISTHPYLDQQSVDFLKKFITQTGEYVLSKHDSFKIEKKHDDQIDVTTSLDREVEKRFFDFVNEKFPQTGFKGEELPKLEKGGEYVWYIDPIDGTKWLAKNIPLWNISIALVHEETETPILGFIYNPVAKQLYHAIYQKGAYLNDKPLELSSETKLSKLQIALDLTPHKLQWEKHSEKILLFVSDLIRNCYRVRAIGLGTSSLTWLANSMFGAYVSPFTHKSKTVDIMAGILLAKEAGAELWKQELEKDIAQVVVARPPVIEQITELLDKSAREKPS